MLCVKQNTRCCLGEVLLLQSVWNCFKSRFKGLELFALLAEWVLTHGGTTLDSCSAKENTARSKQALRHWEEYTVAKKHKFLGYLYDALILF